MTMTFAQQLLDQDIRSGNFASGVASGHWALARPVTAEEWPHVFTYIRAAERPNAPDRYLVRWEVDGYNAMRPSGAFWDEGLGVYLATEKWPKGRPGSIVEKVFRVAGWLHPGEGFYHPYDRKAVKGHDKWVTENPDFIWTEENSLIDFISLVHRLLNSEDYCGC